MAALPSVADIIFATAQEVGVDPTLAYETAYQESRLNQNAVSPAGAIGVMQLMPATAASLGVDPRDLQQNILGGLTYLKQQLDAFGDPAAALAAYNCGPGCVANAISGYGTDWLAHTPAETQNYVATILGNVNANWSASVDPSAVVAAVMPSPVDGSGDLSVGGISVQTILLVAAAALGIYWLADLV